MRTHTLLVLVLLTLFIRPTWADPPFWESPGLQQSQPDPLAPTPPTVQMQSQAVQVYTLPDGRYHAEIHYQDKTDDTRQYTFEGSKEEIRQQLAQSGLPEERKQAVLNALDGNPADMFGSLFSNGFPFGNSLFGGKDPFDHPFFKQNPFNAPLFQNDPFGDDFFEKFLQNIPQLQAPPSGQMKPFPEIQQQPEPVKPALPVQPSGKSEWL